MSTLNVTNLKNPSAASPALVLAADGSATAQLSSINGGPLAGTRNRIINGDMRIDQRNGGASVTLATGISIYTIDRFQAYYSQASKYSIQRNAGSVTPPSGFTNYLGATSLSAYSVTSTDYNFVNQIIEGFNVADFDWGTANAKTVSLSFWVRSSLTGAFSGSMRNANSTRSYVFSYTISAANTWEYKTVVIPGDTTGTWQNTNQAGISLSFCVGSGSSRLGTAGSWQNADLDGSTGTTSVVATNGATFYITGVQLEAGTVATPFERRSFGQELALCQRYYWQGYHSIYAMGANAINVMMVSYPVHMRAAPTASWAPAFSAFVASFSVNSMSITGARTTIMSNTTSGEWTGTISLNAEL
jgi:hypothetical protein